MDLGLSQAGFEVVLAVERDAICVESYHENFPKTSLFHSPVEKLTPEVMADVSTGATREPIALLAGGPPCPPYSKSRFYRKEKPRALDDPLGWSTLQGYLTALSILKPKAFLLENVAGLANSVHRPAMDMILDAADAQGYTC